MFFVWLCLFSFSIFGNSELSIKEIIFTGNSKLPQIDPGKLQYIVKPGDFLGLSKLSAIENEELQKICGISDYEQEEFKVSMGTSAAPGQFPWVVAVGDDVASCTGTIISSRHIATAAHCLTHYAGGSVPCTVRSIATDPIKFNISYGGVCLKHDATFCPDGRDAKIAKVRKVILPQFFNDNLCDKGGDIAIMELKEDIQFDEKAKPICVGYFGENLNGKMFDMGFGRDENVNQVPNLRYILSSLYQKQNITYGNVYTIPQYFDPAAAKHPGLCVGDSGGPFQVNVGSPPRAYLHGIHSIGLSECGTLGIHSSTNVLYFVDWICKQTGICRELQESEEI